MPRWIFLLIVFLLLQILVTVCLQSLRWIMGKQSLSYWVYIATYFAINALLLIAISRVFHGAFAVLATVLTLLWIWFMVSIPIAILNKFFPIAPLWKIALPMSFLLLTAWGWFNAHSPVIRRYSITLDKPSPAFKILLASDLHLGVQTGNKAINRLIAIAAQEKPALIVMPGDIINDDATPYLEQQMDKNLARLQAPYGVYLTLGNHEYYGNLNKNIAALKQSGLTLLQDETHHTHGITIIGREDNTNQQRKPLKALLPKDTSHPIIVLDHQPKDIKTASQLPVDIVVSGHTHRGQIFPANYITRALYRLDYGHAKIGHADFFTTSGYGFWGVPLRLGSRAEVMVIEVTGK